MTRLVEGADQLVADEALVLDIPLPIILPIPRAIYQEEFRTTGRRDNFNRLCDAAADVFELPLVRGNFIEAIQPGAAGRELQNS